MAIERETGARGLRSIMEATMLRPMFDIPSEKNIKRIVITAGYIRGEEELKTVLKDEA